MRACWIEDRLVRALSYRNLELFLNCRSSGRLTYLVQKLEIAQGYALSVLLLHSDSSKDLFVQ
jgi:hypothetical protein